MRGPRGLGKTAMAAWAIHHFALTYDGLDWKVPTTASAWRQLEKFLWPEVHKWAKRLKWGKIGREPYNPRLELQKMNLVLETGGAFAMASDDPETLEGAHADFLFMIFDESKIIPDETWDAVEGAFTAAGGEDETQMGRWLAISTPGGPLGRFYDLHTGKPGYEEWRPVHVTKEQMIAAGRMTHDWAEKRKRQWGEESSLYKQQVTGEFAADDEFSVIPLAWIEAAMLRGDIWRDEIANGAMKGRMTTAGLDVGLGGENQDKSIFAKVYGDQHVDDLELFQRRDVDTTTMELAGRTKGLIDGYGCDIYLDVIGIGVGIFHRLREQKVTKAIAFNAAEGTKRKDITKEFTFNSKRSAAWWRMRELLDPQNRRNISFPRDQQLLGELTAPTYKYLSNAKIQVEKKEDVIKRIKRSTDYADAVIHALTGPDIVTVPTTHVYVHGQGYI